jgi:competence protein ComFC
MEGFSNAFLKLFELKDAKCVYCGRDVPEPGWVCAACRPKQEKLKNKNGFHGSCLHAFDYAGIIRKLLHDFKYNDMPYRGAFMAKKMYTCLLENEVHFDLITFVPIHPRRLAWRGFDQSEVLAGYLSAQTGKMHRPLLRRVRDTAPQFDLAREERQKNVKGAFAPLGKEDLTGQTLLLIDDVRTTGATLFACEKVLEKLGATVISFTFAKEN